MEQNKKENTSPNSDFKQIMKSMKPPPVIHGRKKGASGLSYSRSSEMVKVVRPVVTDEEKLELAYEIYLQRRVARSILLSEQETLEKVLPSEAVSQLEQTCIQDSLDQDSMLNHSALHLQIFNEYIPLLDNLISFHTLFDDEEIMSNFRNISDFLNTNCQQLIIKNNTEMNRESAYQQISEINENLLGFLNNVNGKVLPEISSSLHNSDALSQHNLKSLNNLIRNKIFMSQSVQQELSHVKSDLKYIHSILVSSKIDSAIAKLT